MAAIKKYISYFVVVMVALQVLNLGLYAQDFATIGKDMYGYKPNIINSVTEYIAEVVMNKRNAFPEKKERPNQSDHNPVFKFQPFKIYASSSQQVNQSAIAQDHCYNSYVIRRYINYISDITSPPPKSIV